VYLIAVTVILILQGQYEVDRVLFISLEELNSLKFAFNSALASYEP
jgi:hypothetical protein